MFRFLHVVAKIWLIGWRKHLTTSNDTQMVSRPFDVCGKGFLKGPKWILKYKSSMENASKHL